MPRRKQPPRLYLDPQRQKWVIRYDGYFRRTPYGPDQKDEAENVLKKILGKNIWVEAVRELRPQPKKLISAPWARANLEGVIYFISTGVVGSYPIKIGFSSSGLEKRLGELQTGNPERLIILASDSATFTDEQTLHGMFQPWRLQGEWFSRSIRLLTALEAAENGILRTWIANRTTAPGMSIGAETVPNTKFCE